MRFIYNIIYNSIIIIIIIIIHNYYYNIVYMRIKALTGPLLAGGFGPRQQWYHHRNDWFLTEDCK